MQNNDDFDIKFSNKEKNREIPDIKFKSMNVNCISGKLFRVQKKDYDFVDLTFLKKVNKYEDFDLKLPSYSTDKKLILK